MPDFRLSDEEASAVGAFLAAQQAGADVLANGFRAQALSAFSQNKAKLLLTEKLSCLGCHQLGDRGGRIGPSLSDVGTRLQPAYVHGIIQNPANWSICQTRQNLVLPGPPDGRTGSINMRHMRSLCGTLIIAIWLDWLSCVIRASFKSGVSNPSVNQP